MAVVEGAGSSVLDVVAQLVAAVRNGQLAPGQRLVETDYAKRLGVARTTIREAFQRLEVEGLLSQERNRGFQIRVLDRQALQEIYQAKGALDALAARLAAPHVAADHRGLDEIQAGLEAARSRGNMRDFTRLNQEFHDLIRLMSGNALIGRMLATLERSAYHYQFRLLIDTERVFATQDDHGRIHAALVAGDGAGAGLAAAEHVHNTLDHLMQLPDSFFGA